MALQTKLADSETHPEALDAAVLGRARARCVCWWTWTVERRISPCRAEWMLVEAWQASVSHQVRVTPDHSDSASSVSPVKMLPAVTLEISRKEAETGRTENAAKGAQLQPRGRRPCGSGTVVELSGLLSADETSNQEEGKLAQANRRLPLLP